MTNISTKLNRDSLTLPRLRFWNTLAFRIGILINVTVIIVLGVSEFVNFRRERNTQVGREIERLREEANLLAMARTQIPQRERFQRYVDGFCRQMSATASPGHHILFIDDHGNTLMRAHERADPLLEKQMTAALRAGLSTLDFDGKRYLVVSVNVETGQTIAIAQSLEPIEQMIRAQGASHAVGVISLLLLIFVATTVGLFVWVRQPLRALVSGMSAIGAQEFDVRVRSAGSAELRYLANEINKMAHSLGRVEAARRAEMKKAQGIQQSLLPRNDHVVSGFDLATVFLPTDSVGGDIYDVVELPDGSTLLAVIDVSGHGVPAALFTALLRTTLRHQAASTFDLESIARAMNHELKSIAKQGEFATCYLVRLLKNSGAIEYLSCGHDAALVLRADAETEALVGAGLPLGIDGPTELQVLQSHLASGDRLFLYTDGVHEVFDENDRQLGRTGLEQLLVKTMSMPIEEQLGAVVQSVRAFQHKRDFDDDVTLLCVHRR